MTSSGTSRKGLPGISDRRHLKKKGRCRMTLFPMALLGFFLSLLLGAGLIDAGTVIARHNDVMTALEASADAAAEQVQSKSVVVGGTTVRMNILNTDGSPQQAAGNVWLQNLSDWNYTPLDANGNLSWPTVTLSETSQMQTELQTFGLPGGTYDNHVRVTAPQSIRMALSENLLGAQVKAQNENLTYSETVK